MKKVLWKDYINSNKESILIRNKIIIQNYKLAYKIACIEYKKKFYLSNKLEFDDFLSFANLGLIKAVEGFDVRKKVKFSTYAYLKIQNEIKLGVKKEMRLFCEVVEQEKLINIKSKNIDVLEKLNIEELYLRCKKLLKKEMDRKILELFWLGESRKNICIELKISSHVVDNCRNRVKKIVLKNEKD